MAEDDSFIREVNEEIRQEKARALWGRYGPILIGGAIALVLGTAAWQGISYWNANKAGKIGDSMLEALELSKQGKFDAAMVKLEDVKKTGFGSYPSLAEMRKGSILFEKGDAKAALALFDQVSNDPEAPPILQNFGRVRAAYILVDNGSYDDVEKRVKSLATDIDPMRFSAREALGLSAYKAGKITEAAGYFQKILDDADSKGSGFYERAKIMTDLMKSRGQIAEG